VDAPGHRASGSDAVAQYRWSVSLTRGKFAAGIF
jgi:hypothetical protein